MIAPDKTSTLFTFKGFVGGLLKSWPIAIGVFAYGLVFGFLSEQAGLSLFDAVAMCVIVFAGTSQLVAMGIWITPLPIWTIIFTTFAVNMRYILEGAAVEPYLRGLKRWQKYLSLFYMNDESWALSLSKFKHGLKDRAFMLGSGIAVLIAWTSSTVVGHVMLAGVTDPSRWGLDFALTAVFLSMLVSMWRGKSDIAPSIVAAMVAVAAHKLLPGTWYIFLGAIAGSSASLISWRRKNV